MSKVQLGDVAKEHKETCKGEKSSFLVVGPEHLDAECIPLSRWDASVDITFSIALNPRSKAGWPSFISAGEPLKSKYADRPAMRQVVV